ncbi:MAG: hypothetical protein V1800_12355 [Candidatus Latescibacterota bacterium]
MLDRTWQSGDTIALRLPMKIRAEWSETFAEPATRDIQNPTPPNPAHTTKVGLRRVEKPTAGAHLVAIRRGPLVYTLYIKPQYIQVADERGLAGYPVEEIVPANDSPPWNVALILNKNALESSFEVVKLDPPAGAEPFEYPPIGLRCRAQRIPGWLPGGTPDQPLTTAPPLPIEPQGELLEALLVPFGCTHIRLTWLPFVWSENSA